MRKELPRLPADDQQPVAVERAQAAFADIGGEQVQLRFFGQLEKAGVPVEIALVVVFQQAGARRAGDSRAPLAAAANATESPAENAG